MKAGKYGYLNDKGQYVITDAAAKTKDVLDEATKMLGDSGEIVISIARRAWRISPCR